MLKLKKIVAVFTSVLFVANAVGFADMIEIDNKKYEIIKNYKDVLQVHGFYIDKDIKLINYDLVISFDDEDPEGTIAKIKNETEEIAEGFSVIINYDQDFSLS